jgi:hypothetical protein
LFIQDPSAQYEAGDRKRGGTHGGADFGIPPPPDTATGWVLGQVTSTLH